MRIAQVVWSDEALADLEIIHDFIAEQSHSAAQRTVEGILRRSGQLESFPDSGAKLQPMKSTEKEYRYLVEGYYKIIYSHDQGSQIVPVAVIFDTRSNPEGLAV